MNRFIYIFLLSFLIIFPSQPQTNKKFHPYSGAAVLSFDGAVTYSFTDFKNENLGFIGKVSYEHFLPSKSIGAFGLKLFGGAGTINGEGEMRSSRVSPIQKFNSNIFFLGGGVVYTLAFQKGILPYISAGLSLLNFNPHDGNGNKLPRNAADKYSKYETNFNGELGIRFIVSKNLSVNFNGLLHSNYGDNLDDFSQGDANDIFYSLGAGVSYILSAQKDSDNDGVEDEKDLCPNTPSQVKVDEFGCPLDLDNDGIPDYSDKCSNTPSGVKVDEYGCPVDSDEDGVSDYLDKCSRTPQNVKVDDEGCPFDSDGDGAADYIDKCSDTKSNVKVDSSGCEIVEVEPIKKIKKLVLNGTANFELGKAVLTPNAQKILSALIPSMVEYSKTHWRIEGHTDKTGSYENNQRLSLERARSVMEYFVSQGISRSRFEALGKGQNEPIGDNELEFGRELNRRVEIINLDMPEEEEPKRRSSIQTHIYDYSTEKKIEDKIFSDGILFTIEVSSWDTQRKAQQESGKLRGEGHNPIVLSSPSDKNNIYKIRLGYFKSLKESKNYIAKYFAPETE